MATTKRNSSGSKPQPRNPRPEKRPPLTHFLCLPLVNEASLPQLEASLAAFKEDYPPVPVADLSPTRDGMVQQAKSRPLIPDGAVRPLGTLHLTLGVMSLPKKERLEEAIAFFRSIDLPALMREADRVAGKLRNNQSSSKHDRMHTPFHPCSQNNISSDSFMISLESLHALPRAKSATVLHASPVDPTGRLYPFCIMLRDKFIEAGFIQPEGTKGPNPKDTQDSLPKSEAAPSGSQATDEGLSTKGNISQTQVESNMKTSAVKNDSNPDPYAVALARNPKARPLLLHTTLVNTIYVRGRPKPKGGDRAKQKGGPKRIEFDARDILNHYRDYYSDEIRTTRRPVTSVRHDRQANNSAAQFPFIWANRIPIDSVCICEMGAKRLNIDDASMADPASALWNARLGEKYTVVAERDIGPMR
ncbi:uncharacterized protein N7469_010316 [Penicillium citrinum]|uniref:A-kinase anchor protein 7-like phosphoesterase domain-containing protein n=1 Tax=Penicillium citrinum TaxID=5077 RepID=A0A9W9NK19_PENCI|nr:uncharacterized protein N7469_010316 [Penicillium citrinum]KAJ5221429.1 hypothetical protein N7469_010316 [Penicillium citrinum]